MALQLKGTSEVDAVKYSSTAEILVSAELIAASVNIKKGKVDESTGIDFVAVIDVSGSMAGSPITLVKTSLKFVVETLKPEDQFSIVSFGASAKVDFPLSKMTPEGKKEALNVIQMIKIDTFTNLNAGLVLGIDQLIKRSFKNHTASILLFTDGEANMGVTDSALVVNEMKNGLSRVTGTVSVHTFGFSADHNAGFLTAISDAAAGMYYYVTESKNIPVLFAECLGGLLSTVAKDVKLQVTPAKGIKLHQIMTKYKVSESNGQWIVDIGDIYAEEQRDIPIKVTVPSISSSSTTPSTVVSCSLTYFDLRDKSNSTASIDISILRPQEEVKEDEAARAKAIQVDEQRNRVTAASALETATNLGVSGKLEQAKQAIQDAIHSMEVSKSRNTSYTTSLISDLKEALTRMNSSTDFNHMAAKYLYSMSRSHYNQRSSGVSLSGASAYLTSTKKEFMGIEDKKDVKVVDARSSGKPTLESTRKDKTVVSKEIIAKSIRRLMLDLKEIQSYPLETVTAHPLESDIFEWHCNMRGPMGSPYANTIFHLVFLFPQNYPVQPPKLFNCTFIEHEHVYGTWVCLDLLEEAQWSGSESNKPYTGWTTAYSVQSILLQLQSFLFDKASTNTVAVEKAEKSSQQFRCEQCGHCSTNVWPKFPTVAKQQDIRYKEIDVKNERQVYLFEEVAKETVAKETVVAKEEKKEEKKQEIPKQEVPVVAKETVAKDTPKQTSKTTSPVITSPPVAKEPTPKQEVPIVAKDTPKQEPPKTPSPPKEVTLKTAPSTVKLVANSQWKAVPSTLWNAPSTTVVAPVKKTVQVEKKPQVENKVESKVEQPKVETKAEKPKKKQKEQKPKQAEKIVVQLKPNQSLWAKPPSTLYQDVSKPVVKATVPSPPKPVVKETQQQPEKKEEVKKKEVKSTPIVPVQVEVKGAWAARKANNAPIANTVVEQPKKKEEEVKPVVQVETKVEKVPEPKVAVETKPVEKKQVKSKKTIQVGTQLEKITSKGIKGSILTHILSQLPKLTSGLSSSYFTFLLDDVIIRIFSFLTIRDLALLSMVCKDFLRLSCHPSLWSNLFTQYYPNSNISSHSIQAWKHIFATERKMIEQSLVCFHTKGNFRETVLGIPISFSTNPRTGNIDKITSTLDLLSYEAFYEDNVRKSVWKVGFTHWLPLYLSHNHGERALPLIQKTLASLLNKNRFKPEMALDIIPKLMNTMVVNLMSGDLHASIAALEGYCAFHRLLLFFVSKYPELQDTVNEKAVSFVRNEENRHKEVMPSLGEFLPLLTVSNKVTWKEACMPYLYENFDRNALWTLKKYPGLATLESDAVNWDRLNKTFDATQVSIRLLMFHVYFFNKVARPENVSLQSVANNYDAFYGRPSSEMKEALQKKCKEILGIKGWQEFFQGIGMVPPSPQYLTKWLRDSVKNSLRKGYHSKNMR